MSATKPSRIKTANLRRRVFKLLNAAFMDSEMVELALKKLGG